MAKIPATMVDDWRGKANAFLADHGFDIADVTLGVDAWTICTRCGMSREAYGLDGVNDAHIQTALEKVFPNAIFRDPKRY